MFAAGGREGKRAGPSATVPEVAMGGVGIDSVEQRCRGFTVPPAGGIVYFTAFVV